MALLISVATAPAFAEVEAYINQPSFYEGDPITLKINSAQNSDNVEPELAVLEKDFTILDVRESKQPFTFNGKRSYIYNWTIELQPNQNGILEIPSIKVGKEKTEVITLKIIDLPPEVTAEMNKHIFIETDVGEVESTTFVQQQIPYTIKLFYDSSIQTAQINAPDIKNAILERLGRDKRYQVIRAGKRFNVVERHFVISPEKSGPLHIPTATVTGRIALSDGSSQRLRGNMDETEFMNKMFMFNELMNNSAFSRGFFSGRLRGPSKPFTIKGKTIDVDVLPVPKAFTGTAWLPAEDLIIKDSWAKQPPQLKVGEPVTRLLTLQAKGLAGSQIPDIHIPKPDNMKVYPNKANSVTETDGNTLYGIQRINISYIPDSSGKVNIPEIKVDWWDVKNKKQKTFVLPAWNLNVAPDPTKVIETKPPSELLQEPLPSTEGEKSAVAVNKNLNVVNKFWAWALIIIAPLLLLFATLFYKFRKYLGKKGDQQIFQRNKPQQDIAALRSSLLQACNNNDKQRAAHSFIKYAQAHWHDDALQNLGMIAAKLKNSPDVKIVKDLEQSLYSLESGSWQGDALGKLIENGLPQEQERLQQMKGDLTPLYPA